MNECMIHVWGGAWNDDAEPSIEKDYGIAEGYYYFKDKKAERKFMDILYMPVYFNQGITTDYVSEETTGKPLTYKRTIFVGLYEWQGRRYTIHYDFGFEFPEDRAEHMFLLGSYSDDYNISRFIRQEHGYDSIVLLDDNLNEEIKLIAYKIEHWDSYYRRYDGDKLMERN